MSFTKFVTYDAMELEQAGRACCRAARQAEPDDWTRFVMRWFCEAAADGIQAWPPSPDSRAGEFLVDHCQFRAPPRGEDETWLDWYQRAFGEDTELVLALESEWGKRGTKSLSTSLVLDDAMKLAVLRARAKVIVFASRDGTNRQSTLDLLGKMRRSLRDEAPWLWIDLPWRAVRGGEWEPASGVLR